MGHRHDRISTAWTELQNERTRLEGLQAEKIELEDELTEKAANQSGERSDSIKSATVTGGAIAFVGIVVGTILATVGQPIGGGVAGRLGLLGALWYIRQKVDGALDTQESTLDTDALSSVESQISIVQGDLKQSRRTFTDAVTDVHDAEREFRALVERLGLPKDASPSTVQSFYEDLDEVQGDIESYRDDVTALGEDREDLEAELTAAAAVTQELVDFTWDDDDPLAHSERLYSAVQDVADVVEDTREYQRAHETLDELRSKAIELLEDWANEDAISEEKADVDRLRDLLNQYEEEARRTAAYQDQRQQFEALGQRLTRWFDSSSIVDAFEPFCRDVESR